MYVCNACDLQTLSGLYHNTIMKDMTKRQNGLKNKSFALPMYICFCDNKTKSGYINHLQ